MSANEIGEFYCGRALLVLIIVSKRPLPHFTNPTGAKFTEICVVKAPVFKRGDETTFVSVKKF